jgi:hypothetical protein
MKVQKILIVVLLIVTVLLLIGLYKLKSVVSGADFIEVYARGIVVDNSLENSDVGSYLHLKQQNTNDDIFVVYRPFASGKELDCLNPIDVHNISVRPPTTVEVRGRYLNKVNGQTPQNLMISTCESQSFYIRIVK